MPGCRAENWQLTICIPATSSGMGASTAGGKKSENLQLKAEN
jgi:hypothetical protein